MYDCIVRTSWYWDEDYVELNYTVKIGPDTDKVAAERSVPGTVMEYGTKPQSNKQALETDSDNVCIFFEDFSQFRALCESKVLSSCSPVHM